MSKKNSITSYLMPITALCILLFFGYKGFVIKSVKFDDIIFLTKTVDGQQDNVVILPSNELLWTKTYGNHVEASLCKITGQFANHYFFGLYRLGSFPFGLRYFKNPKAVYKVDLKIIKKEGDSFPSVGTTNETRIVIYEDRGTIGSNEFRIVSLSESEKKELLRNLKIMVREM